VTSCHCAGRKWMGAQICCCSLPQHDEFSHLPLAPAAGTSKRLVPGTEHLSPCITVDMGPSIAPESISPEAEGAVIMPPKRPRQTTRSRALSLVAAGHAAAGGVPILEDEEDLPNGTPTVLKELADNELQAYETLAYQFKGDSAHGFVPMFGGVVDGINEKGDIIKMIRMGNLLYGFSRPKVMDVKLGVRTFLESECANKKLRPDLFTRAEKLYPLELTEEERAAQGMTKHRWMTIRDKCTTIGSLGYRIDGIAGYRSRTKKDIDDELSKFRTMEDTAGCLRSWVEATAVDEEVATSTTPLVIAQRLLERLQQMRASLATSDFIRCHEFIGTSILLVADPLGNAGANWIDFAKTVPIESGQITHLRPWEIGNHEDGILLGIDCLMTTFERVIELLRASAGSTADSNGAGNGTTKTS